MLPCSPMLWRSGRKSSGPVVAPCSSEHSMVSHCVTPIYSPFPRQSLGLQLTFSFSPRLYCSTHRVTPVLFPFLSCPWNFERHFFHPSSFIFSALTALQLVLANDNTG